MFIVGFFDKLFLFFYALYLVIGFDGLIGGDPIYVRLPLKLKSYNRLGFFYISERSRADISNYYFFSFKTLVLVFFRMFIYPLE